MTGKTLTPEEISTEIETSGLLGRDAEALIKMQGLTREKLRLCLRKLLRLAEYLSSAKDIGLITEEQCKAIYGLEDIEKKFEAQETIEDCISIIGRLEEHDFKTATADAIVKNACMPLEEKLAQLQLIKKELFDEILQQGYDEGLIGKRSLDDGKGRIGDWYDTILGIHERREAKARMMHHCSVLGEEGLISNDEVRYIQGVLDSARFEMAYYNTPALRALSLYFYPIVLRGIANGWSVIQKSGLQKAIEVIPKISDLAERFKMVGDVESWIKDIEKCAAKLRTSGYITEADSLFASHLLSERVSIMEKLKQEHSFLRPKEPEMSPYKYAY